MLQEENNAWNLFISKQNVYWKKLILTIAIRRQVWATTINEIWIPVIFKELLQPTCFLYQLLPFSLYLFYTFFAWYVCWIVIYFCIFCSIVKGSHVLPSLRDAFSKFAGFYRCLLFIVGHPETTQSTKQMDVLRKLSKFNHFYEALWIDIAFRSITSLAVWLWRQGNTRFHINTKVYSLPGHMTEYTNQITSFINFNLIFKT